MLIGEAIWTCGERGGSGVVQRHKLGLEVGEGERLKIRLELRRAESTTDKGNWHGYLQDEVVGGLSTISRVGLLQTEYLGWYGYPLSESLRPHDLMFGVETFRSLPSRD